ncbi:MAG: APC family permease [Elusimicrobiota bacterium]
MVKVVRRLSFLDVFCLGLNAIIGSGIFLFPGTLAALAGPASILAFLVCGLLLTTVALCYAELGGMFPGNGGSYLYAREAFGDTAGFGVGLVAWAAAVLSWAAVASILAGHLGFFHPFFDAPAVRKAVAAGGLVVFGAVNYRGVKPGAWTVDFLTAAKVLPLLLFVIAGLSSVSPGRYAPLFSGEMRFGYAVFLALWALQGFEVVAIPAGETECPQRDVPRAVVGSLVTAAVLYTLIQAVAVGAYPGLAGSSERPLADAAAHFMGSWGGGLLAVGGVVSMLGFIAGAALGAPRYLSALGERSLLRWGLGAVHARFKTPHRSILATTGTAVLLALAFDFGRLIDLSNLAVVSQYLASCLALAALRVRRPQAPRPYRMPWARGIVPAGCLISVCLISQVGPREVLGSTVLLAGGYALRAVLDRGGEP